MMATILKDQIMSCYNIPKSDLPLMKKLPIELGGFPDIPVYTMAVCGNRGHYDKLYNTYIKEPTSPEAMAVLNCLKLSMTLNIHGTKMAERAVKVISTFGQDNSLLQEDAGFGDRDFESIVLPGKAEVFSAIKQMVIKDKKTSLTLDAIKKIPFEGNGLAMLDPRPKDLQTTLGNLKDKSKSMVYELAASGYTSSKKRMAMNQAIFASGRYFRVPALPRPINRQELLHYFSKLNLTSFGTMESLKIAFDDESGIVGCCDAIVKGSEIYKIHTNKTNTINHFPEYENPFQCMTNIKSVMYSIIDDDDPNLGKPNYEQYMSHPLLLMDQDKKNIKARFARFFEYYNVKMCVNLIMQMYLDSKTKKIFTQPRCSNADVLTFLPDLYGNVLERDSTYRLDITYTDRVHKAGSAHLVNTLYTCTVLNAIYNQVVVTEIGGLSPGALLNSIDHAGLASSELVKYAALQLKYNNVHQYLRDYDTSLGYRDYWQIKQTNP